MPEATSTLRIGEHLDRLTWTPAHTGITLALGIGWMLDAFEVNVVASVLGVLRGVWKLTETEASAIVSVWLVGIMIGAFFFGYLADRFGRRRLFLLTLLLYSVCTVISALSPNYLFFMVFRFLTALGVGAEYSAVNAAIGEFIPARYRGRVDAAVMNFWPLGTILAAGATLYFVNLFPLDVGWRLAFALGAIVALFTIWARKLLPESPRWLCQQGRIAEAEAVVARLEYRLTSREHNPAPAGPSTARPKVATAAGPLKQVRRLVRNYPGRLALGCALDFTEAAGYYGIFAFVPLVVLPHLNISETRVPFFFLVGNLGAVAGGLLAALSLDAAGRKPTVTGFYALAALSMLGMGAATFAGSAGALLWAFVVANFCASGSWISAYPTFSEIFPTSMRSTGIGFSVAFGRIGAALAPPLLIYLSSRFSMGAAFATLAGFYALGVSAMIPWWLWGLEGRRRSLEVLAGEATSPQTAKLAI